MDGTRVSYEFHRQNSGSCTPILCIPINVFLSSSDFGAFECEEYLPDPKSIKSRVNPENEGHSPTGGWIDTEVYELYTDPDVNPYNVKTYGKEVNFYNSLDFMTT